MSSLEDCLNPEMACFPAYEEHMERYRFASKFSRGKRILDIACGAGYGARMLAAAGARSVVGADISEKNILYAQAHYAATAVAYVVHDVRKPLNREAFDLVVSFETIEHVGEDVSVMATLFSSLREGGMAIVSTPNRMITNPGLAPDTPCNLGGHVREYTIHEFRDLAAGAGFIEIALFGQRQQRAFNNPVIEKYYKRLFRPSRRASPVVSQVRRLTPEYAVFILTK